MVDFSSVAVRDSETLAVYGICAHFIRGNCQLLSTRYIQTQPPLRHIDIIETAASAIKIRTLDKQP